jgi:ATP-binding cassette subfamily B protein
VPQYRYLLAADDELDDGAERSCAWEEDEDRSRLEHLVEEHEPRDYVSSEAERR